MKKKINILLIIAVGGLWGTVGYRFISNYFFTNEVNNAIAVKTNYKTKLITQRDTFELQNLSRDPFLNKLHTSTAAYVNIPGKTIAYKTKRNTPVIKPVAAAKYWPEIQYFGYIKSGKNNEVALLKINGQLLKLHKGESRNEITVQNVFKDSIAVVFNKEKKVFKHS